MFLGEDAACSTEVGLFDQWMKKTHPSEGLDLFGMFSWASAKLFVDALKAAGQNPTRAGVIAALKSIHTFADNGMVAQA